MIVELTDIRGETFAFRAKLFDSASREPAVGDMPVRTVVRLSNGVLGFVKERPSEIVACVEKAQEKE